MPITSYIVLGLLAFGEPLSGYEIRKRGESLRHFYWSPAQSQIYRELRRLEAEGLATARYVAQVGKPDKQLFQITATGTAVFQQWLNHAELPPTVIKHPVLLKLFFGQLADPAALAETVRRYLDTVNEALAQLAIVAEFVAEDEMHQHEALIAEWNTHYYEAERTMAQTVLARLLVTSDG